MPLLDLIGSLGIIAGAHGVAQPGGACTPRTTRSRRRRSAKPGEFSSPRIAEDYLRVLRAGAWFTPLREALDAYVDAVQERVTGVVRLKLFKGDCAVGDVAGRRPRRRRSPSRKTLTTND